MSVIAQFQTFALHSLNANPNVAAEPGFIGDLLVRLDAGQVRLYVNTTGTTVGWEEVPLGGGTWSLGSLLNVILADNLSPAMDIGSTGLLNLLRIVTTNGAERLDYNGAVPLRIVTGGVDVQAGNVTIAEGLLQSLATAVSDFALNTPGPTFIVRTNHPGGNVNANVGPLPARAGGWRLQDAYIRSIGATAGTAQLFDAAAGNAMTNTLVPGNADVITRAGSLVAARESVGSGATPVWTGAAGPPAFTGYTIWSGL